MKNSNISAPLRPACGVERRSDFRCLTAASALFLLLATRVLAVPYIVVTTPVDGSTITNAPTSARGWVTNSGAAISNVAFPPHEQDPGSEPGRYWNGLSGTTTPSQPPASHPTTNGVKAARVTLPP